MVAEDHQPQIIGNYRIATELGRGGMGVVYDAQHLLTGRRTALKVLAPELVGNPDHLQRFLREGKLAANLDHPNIVRVYEVGESDGTYFMAMEFVEGMPLSELLRHYGKLDAVRATKVILQAATAMAVAHDAGIIHRDIKPANILIPRKGGLKIADFGLARALFGATTITETGAVMGTPHYMSPEQCRGDAVNTRTDIYSLGVVYFELLTGQRPFSAEALHSLIYKILEGNFPSAKGHDPGIPQAVDNVVHHMTALEPSDRYISMQEVVEDLRACLEKRSTKADEARSLEALAIPDILEDTTIVLPPKMQPRQNSWPFRVAGFALLALAVGLGAWGWSLSTASLDNTRQNASTVSNPDFTTREQLAELPVDERRAAQIANANIAVFESEPESDVLVTLERTFHPTGTVMRYSGHVSENGGPEYEVVTTLRTKSAIELNNGIVEYEIETGMANGRDTFSFYWLLFDGNAYHFTAPETTHPTNVFSYPIYRGKTWQADVLRGNEDGTRTIRRVSYFVDAERTFFSPSEGEYRALRVRNSADTSHWWLAPEIGLVYGSDFERDPRQYPGVRVTRPSQFRSIEFP